MGITLLINEVCKHRISYFGRRIWRPD